MERFGFGVDAALTPRGEELLERVTVAPLTRALAQGSSIQAAVFRIAPGGRIGRHTADVPQILAVLEGAGEVSGAGRASGPIGPGEAVFWDEGEEHGATSDGGLTALILEGPGLQPFRRPHQARGAAVRRRR